MLLPEEIVCPFNNNSIKIGNDYWLYQHPDLGLTQINSNGKLIILLGDMFDYQEPANNNEQILNDLVKLEFSALLERIGDFAGRFVLILFEMDRFIILHDATAARKVFFSERNGAMWFSSQQHLLAKVMGISRTENPSKLAFYGSDFFPELNNSDLGNTTYYDEISQMMSNHYFDVRSRSVARYWPLHPLPRLTFKEVADKCTHILSGHLTSISKRYDIMLPVTGGSDSRLLMSATKAFRGDVLYYINQIVHSRSEDRDIKTSKKLFRKLGMDFNVLPLTTEIDPEFKKIYFDNNPLASNFFLPHIYNYYLHFQDKINLPGHIASAPWGVYQMDRRKVTINEIIDFYEVPQFEYAHEYYHQWMSGVNNLCNNCGLNVINLFYWEERINNWGNQVSIDKDIAQEEVNPLNSRVLNELYLSIPLKYNNEPDKKLHRQIILNLWPELMKLPFNPSFRTMLLLLLARTGLFTPVARTLYRLSRRT